MADYLSPVDDRLGSARGDARRSLAMRRQNGVKGVESADKRAPSKADAALDGCGHELRVMNLVVGTSERTTGDGEATLHLRIAADDGSGFGSGDRSAERIEVLHGSERPGVDVD